LLANAVGFYPDANLLNCHLIVAAAESLCQKKRAAHKLRIGGARPAQAQDLLRRKTCSGARPAQMFLLLFKAPSRELKVGKVEG
jgi:hypothetical protein